MYADTPLGGPDLAPTDTTEQAETSRLETVANKVVSALKSKQAKLLYRMAFTTVVVGVALSMAVAAHVLVRGIQAGVNALAFVWWTADLTMLLVSVLCTASWRCRRRPHVWHVDFSTNSWCNVQAAQRVWEWSALRSV
jgi:hypothetical protein